jgi:hypothetical protein
MMRHWLFGLAGPRPVSSLAVAAIPTILLFLPGATAPSRHNARTPVLISEQQAMDAVAKLPEVQAFGAMLGRVTIGAVRLTLYCEEKPRPDDQSWQVYVGESHADHTVIWNRFRVDAKTGDVAVWDFADDGWTPSGDWRRKAAFNEHAVADGRVGATLLVHPEALQQLAARPVLDLDRHLARHGKECAAPDGSLPARMDGSIRRAARPFADTPSPTASGRYCTAKGLALTPALFDSFVSGTAPAPSRTATTK